MKRDSLKNLFSYLNLIILLFAVIFLVFNFEVVSVIHAKASEWLPVQVYATYTSTQTSIFYILMLLVIANLLVTKLRYLRTLKPYVILLTSIVAIISIILLMFNPHSMILVPLGWPPTQLDNIEIGGIAIIIVSGVYITNSLCQLYLEGNLKIYLKVLGVIIGALLLSDFIHESGHAVIALITGGEVTVFFPFPVLLGGEFNAGYVSFSNVPYNLIPLVILGGEIFQWLTIGIILGIIYFKPKYRKSLFMRILLFIGLLDFPLYVINNMINLPHWFLIGSTNGDLMIFRN